MIYLHLNHVAHNLIPLKQFPQKIRIIYDVITIRVKTRICFIPYCWEKLFALISHIVIVNTCQDVLNHPLLWFIYIYIFFRAYFHKINTFQNINNRSEFTRFRSAEKIFTNGHGGFGKLNESLNGDGIPNIRDRILL